jgi:hypothetical protein
LFLGVLALESSSELKISELELLDDAFLVDSGGLLSTTLVFLALSRELEELSDDFESLILDLLDLLLSLDLFGLTAFTMVAAAAVVVFVSLSLLAVDDADDEELGASLALD